MNNIHQKILFSLVAYTLVVGYWMLFGFGRTVSPDFMYNLTPFETIIIYMQFDNFNTYSWVMNLLGNIGVFVPFGIFIPLVTRKRLIQSFLLFIICILILETLQLLTKRGSFDIDDFILNSIGFFIGYISFMAIKIFTHDKI
ncbi:VanZ family protein [Bacillus pinisoli]|uniref:VanZ family protein n=1 Tax=Bacillus pinisoli TaxID=2901866 RepID=UPI001FF39C06|nr:VanZ family protein [Bacillus pinisoli]